MSFCFPRIFLVAWDFPAGLVLALRRLCYIFDSNGRLKWNECGSFISSASEVSLQPVLLASPKLLTRSCPKCPRGASWIWPPMLSPLCFGENRMQPGGMGNMTMFWTEWQQNSMCRTWTCVMELFKVELLKVPDALSLLSPSCPWPKESRQLNTPFSPGLKNGSHGSINYDIMVRIFEAMPFSVLGPDANECTSTKKEPSLDQFWDDGLEWLPVDLITLA